MTPDAAFALELAAVAGLAVLIVAIVVASMGACDPPAAAAAAAVHDHDVERALGPRTLVTYEQAKADLKARRAAAPSKTTEGEEEAPPSCAICLSEYAKGDEVVRVLPACGHFFHAECGIDRWLRTRGTCPYCRAGLRPLPRPPRPECPPLPPRAGGGAMERS